MLSLEEGKAAVKLARDALAAYLQSRQKNVPEGLAPVFEERRGVFVTLHLNGELRGCIGYPQPVMPLARAIVDSAIHAGTGDPRFPPVTAEELKRIDIEVTILTPPERLEGDRMKLPQAVKIGKHGLIVSKGMLSGLLLPQVATEWNFDPEDFLCQTCLKAGLPVDAWLDPQTEVQCFEAQIFSEEGPGGPVVQRELQQCGCE
ncbi:MAG: TIGR00296 family protein [Methanosarcinales archaeon]|nr:TIGR00296 family protein [Methanosarcinales archaeon]